MPDLKTPEVHKNYPRRLIQKLTDKYIIQNRIPSPTSLEGDDRWVVAKIIKKDVRSLSKWYIEKQKASEVEQAKVVAEKLLNLYINACRILQENSNERDTYCVHLSAIGKLK